jgi:hypothetical protein
MRYRTDITAEFLRSILTYDPETGEWHWIDTKFKKHVDKPVCGGAKKQPQIRINGRNYLASRLAFLYMTGNWPAELIDHIDLNPTNNRWSNLREATKAKNAYNTRLPAHNTSGHKGVSWIPAKKLWCAYIKVNNKRKYLGKYKVKEDAVRAYRDAALTYHGEFARFF